MAYSVIDIAKKIVCKTDVEHGDTISNLKLRSYSHTQINHEVQFQSCCSCEKMMTICDQRMDDILSGQATTISHDEVMRRMSDKYGLAL